LPGQRIVRMAGAKIRCFLSQHRLPYTRQREELTSIRALKLASFV
jgi:hypothetical protein